MKYYWYFQLLSIATSRFPPFCQVLSGTCDERLCIKHLLQALCNILTNIMSDPRFPFSATAMSCLARGETVNGPKVFSFETLPRAAPQLGRKKSVLSFWMQHCLPYPRPKTPLKPLTTGHNHNSYRCGAAFGQIKTKEIFNFRNTQTLKNPSRKPMWGEGGCCL